MTSFTPHWTAQLLPEMDAEAFERLKSDIKRNGQIEPIVLWRNQIVDGRHRYRACVELGREPSFEILAAEITERDVFARALSKNIVRRHLTPGQKALIAHDLLHGEAAANLQTHMNVAQAAGLLGVSDSAVNMLIATLKKAPHLRDDVSSGKLTINAANDLANLAVVEPAAAAEALEAVREAPTPKAAKKVAAKATAGVRESRKKGPVKDKSGRKGKATTEPESDELHWSVAVIAALRALPQQLKSDPPDEDVFQDLASVIEEAFEAINAYTFTHEEA